MARDSSGNFTLPAGNPVVTATVVDSSDHNDTMSDVATELTDSLSRSAKGAMLGVLKIVDGSVSSPGLQFSNDANTGVYRITTDTLGLAAGGVLVVRGEAATVTVPVVLVVTGALSTNSTAAVDLTDSTVAFLVGTAAGQHVEIDTDEIQSKSDATTAAILALNRFGGDVNVGAQSGTGAARLYANGTARLVTTVNGADIAGTILGLANPAGTDTYLNARNTAGGFSLTLLAAGDARLFQTNASGVNEDIWLTFTRNGAVAGYLNNLLNWSGLSQGFGIQSTTGTSTLLDLYSTAAGLEARLQSQSAGQLLLTAELANRGVRLQGTDSGGADSVLFDGLPDGPVTLFYDNVAKLFTQVNGGSAGSAANVSPDGSSSGQFQLIGSGYTGYLTLDGTAMYVGHNSGARNLALRVNAVNMLNIVPGGAATLKYASVDALATADIATNGAGATVTDGGGTARPVGFNATPITSIAVGTDLRVANAGHQLYATASLAVDIDTTTDSAPTGSVWVIANESGGNITVTATGVTLRWFDGSTGGTGTRTLANYAYATVTKRANGLYQIVGTGVT